MRKEEKNKNKNWSFFVFTTLSLQQHPVAPLFFLMCYIFFRPNFWIAFAQTFVHYNKRILTKPFLTKICSRFVFNFEKNHAWQIRLNQQPPPPSKVNYSCYCFFFFFFIRGSISFVYLVAVDFAQLGGTSVGVVVVHAMVFSFESFLRTTMDSCCSERRRRRLREVFNLLHRVWSLTSFKKKLKYRSNDSNPDLFHQVTAS